MRIVIKNADFSSVSIGKVVKDLSFREYYNPIDPNFFLNVSEEGVVTPTDGYRLTDGAVVAGTNIERAITDYIEVVPGMKIDTVGGWHNTPTNPSIICFNSNKELLSDKYAVVGNLTLHYTVPEGVYYVRIQCDKVMWTDSTYDDPTHYLEFSMPE